MLSRKSNVWRDFYNPLRGMSVPRLVTLLEAGERGQYADLQWFYYFMERSDAMIFSIIQRRKAALLDSDWDIRVNAEVNSIQSSVFSGRAENGRKGAGADQRLETGDRRHAGGAGGGRKGAQGARGEGRGSKSVQYSVISGGEGKGAKEAKGDAVLAEEQAACLREVYDGIENFRDAVSFLFSGFFRGYAHLEKHFAQDGAIERLEPVEQWFWVRDGMFGDWEYNENAVSGRRRGIAIEREDFVVFESVALNRMLAVLYLRRNLSQKDWDSYLEVFGIPSTFIIGPPNRSDAEVAEFQAIADQIISDGRGYLPHGSDLKFVTGGALGGSGGVPFKQHLEYLDQQITIVGTGGLLTMLAQAGSGTLAGNAHEDTFTQIARGDAAMLSEVFQRDVDRAVLEAAFPGQPALAYFEFARAAGEQDVSRVVQDAAALAGAGYPMEAGELSEKTGYRLGAAGAAVRSDR